jgi:hypothetical protein
MSGENEAGSPAERNEPPAGGEHLNIKVTDNNNEVFFKIKRSTKLEKLMTAFCERQGKNVESVRFLFEGQRVQKTDTPDSVSFSFPLLHSFPMSINTHYAIPTDESYAPILLIYVGILSASTKAFTDMLSWTF